MIILCTPKASIKKAGAMRIIINKRRIILVIIFFIPLLIYYSSRMSGESEIEIITLKQRLNETKIEADTRRDELNRLQKFVQQLRAAEKEVEEKNSTRLGTLPLWSSDNCQMDFCFDYSLCPLSSKFQFYLYSLNGNDINSGSEVKFSVSNFLEKIFPFIIGKTTNSGSNVLHEKLSHSSYRTLDYTKACFFILIIDDCNPQTLLELSKNLYLADGRNHVLWIECGMKFPDFLHFPLDRAMLISENAKKNAYRSQFDLVVSHWEKAIPSGQVWSQLPPLLPVKRKYLASFIGSVTDKSIKLEIFEIQKKNPQSFVFQFSCTAEQNEFNSAFDWNGFSSKSLKFYSCEGLLAESIFSLLILPPNDTDILSSVFLQQRLFEMLKHGCIPVVIGTRFLPPFSEVIDWSKIIIRLPHSRITEIHYILQSFSEADLIQMKKQGRLVFEKYLSSVENTAETVLAVLRTRIGIPPSPYKDVGSPSPFNIRFVPQKPDLLAAVKEENVGTLEPPFPSPSFMRNYSALYFQKYDLWNTYFQPLKLFPSTPWDPKLSYDAEGLSIAAAVGSNFSESLGGNSPKEQFTIVILTYKREKFVLNSLHTLSSLPYLNKVVIVWNSPDPPSSDLEWPDIGVPIHMIKAEKNSINNRFLPFDVVETEAILILDDDIILHHDEIVFGFRVWRENRDRIVGFIGRSHILNKPSGSWLYNWDTSCEHSMVLTGAAFYHKVYSYLYTYEMPAAIRDKVDELMNCEDIAMNFLVSHVTRKPPVLVNSYSSLQCQNCSVSISKGRYHLKKRTDCLNFFSEVYGYTPLLYTQYRADSILFNKNITESKKCFKNI